MEQFNRDLAAMGQQVREKQKPAKKSERQSRLNERAC